MVKKTLEFNRGIGTAISMARKGANIKQYQLANKVGVTPVYMSQLENNKKLPSIKTLFKISKELNVDPDQLIQGDALFMEVFKPVEEKEHDIKQTIKLLERMLNTSHTP